MKYIIDMENGSVVFRGTTSIDIRLDSPWSDWTVQRSGVAGLIPPWCSGLPAAPHILTFSPMGKLMALPCCWGLTSGQSTTTPRWELAPWYPGNHGHIFFQNFRDWREKYRVSQKKQSRRFRVKFLTLSVLQSSSLAYHSHRLDKISSGGAKPHLWY